MGTPLTYPPEEHAGTITSWLPLTTAWPPATSCDSLYYQYDPAYAIVYEPAYGIDMQKGLNCLPPAVTSWWNQDRLGNNIYNNTKTAISLGPVTCPEVYVTVNS